METVAEGYTLEVAHNEWIDQDDISPTGRGCTHNCQSSEGLLKQSPML